MKIPQETIDKASAVNLIDYCRANNIELKKEGSEYIVKEYDSLYISEKEPNRWFRHSTGEGGKAIDFLVQIYKYSFREAVTKLTNKHFDNSKNIYQKNQKQIIGYLKNTRKLDLELIYKLIRENKLDQDEHKNCNFKIFDFQGNFIASEVKGTGSVRFQGVSASQQGFGFTCQIGSTEIDTIAFFESAIDLLSFYQMYHSAYEKKERCLLLVSMAGLKSTVVKNYCEHYPAAKAILCVDNDTAGKSFAERLHMTCYYPPSKKDWNDYLKDRGSRLEKSE